MDCGAVGSLAFKTPFALFAASVAAAAALPSLELFGGRPRPRGGVFPPGVLTRRKNPGLSLSLPGDEIDANFELFFARPESDRSLDSKYFAGRLRPSFAMAAALPMALTFLEDVVDFLFPAPDPARFAIASFVVPGGLPRPRFIGLASSSPDGREFSLSGVFLFDAFPPSRFAPGVAAAGASFGAFDVVFRSRVSGSFVNALVDFFRARTNNQTRAKTVSRSVLKKEFSQLSRGT